MHKILPAIFACFLCIPVLKAKTDSLSVKMIPGFESRELQRLSTFQGFEQIRMQFSGSQLKGSEFHISFETYDSGKVTSKGRLTTGLPGMLLEAKADTFEMQCISQATSDSVKVNFYYPRFSTSTFFGLKRPKSHYSMRSVLPTDESGLVRFSADTDKHALLVYSLPYERADAPGQSFYCELTREGVPPALWWDKFKVAHYIVFYVRLKKSGGA